MFKLQDNIEQEFTLNPTFQNSFKCNNCKELAQQPVITLCGHLYCWHCIYDKKNCPACFRQFQQQQFVPIYTSHESQQKRRQIRSLPPKPKARLRQKIKNFNPGSNNNLPIYIRLQNNVQRNIIVAGNGYFPSTIINFFGNFDQNQQNEEPQGQNIKNSMGTFSLLLLSIVCVLILLS